MLKTSILNWTKSIRFHFKPEEKIEDVFENDVKLDYCVTPNRVYEF
jgi:hypothetical protein